MDEFYRGYLDAPLERRHTDCHKWDNLKGYFGREDILAMWVADMDFPAVPEVAKAVAERAAHPVYGYTIGGAEKQAEAEWLKRRHNLTVQPEWILSSPGVVDSMAYCARALTEKNEPILVQPPIYGAFHNIPREQERVLRYSPLLREDGVWKMDYEDMERAFQEGVKLIMLCNPHNPVGRVWTEDELCHVLALANRYGAYVLCDEIHAEFTFERKICHILSLPNTENVIMLSSATKAFNLAGLRHSSVIIPNAELRGRIEHEMRVCHGIETNLFGALATCAAYTYGDVWMDAVIEYIRENRDIVCKYMREHVPNIPVYPQEGTYLMWLDCRKLGLSDEALMRRMVDIGGVGLNRGTDFGQEGSGYMRLNIATQKENLMRALEGIRKAAEQ